MNPTALLDSNYEAAHSNPQWILYEVKAYRQQETYNSNSKSFGSYFYTVQSDQAQNGCKNTYLKEKRKKNVSW